MCGPVDLYFIHNIHSTVRKYTYVIACTYTYLYIRIWMFSILKYVCVDVQYTKVCMYVWMFSILKYACVDVQYTKVCMCGCLVY